MYSAGIVYKNEYGVVALGYPFETITTQKAKDNFMLAVLKYFKIR